MGPPRREGDKTQRAQIVHPQDMIGVRVRIEHGIHAREALAQRLFAEVRAGIDYDNASRRPSRAPSIATVPKAAARGRADRRSCTPRTRSPESEPPSRFPFPKM